MEPDRRRGPLLDARVLPAVTALIRASIDVNGHPASYLTAGTGPVLLLLHGTYWSRVWQPIIADLARGGLQPVAVDLPGCGRSAGELRLDTASVPALAAWVADFTRAFGAATVAGHDIGGAIAQRLLVTGEVRVERIALINSVTYDSWPVPGVARYRDPKVIAATTVDSRYTTELLDALRADGQPKLLIWGQDDQFPPISYARRFAAEMPRTTLIPIPRAGHIPMENDPSRVAATLLDFVVASPRDDGSGSEE